MYRIDDLTNELIPLFRKIDNIIETIMNVDKTYQTFIHNYIDILNSNLMKKK